MTSNHDDDQFDDLEMFDDVSDETYDAPVNGVPDAGGAEEPYEEDWDSFDETAEGVEDDSAEPAAPQKQKKSGNFNKIVIGAGVLVGAVVMLMQLGGGDNNSAPPPAPDMVQVDATPPMQNQMQNQVDANAPAPGGFLTNPEGMAALERDIVKTYNETEVISYDDPPAEVDQATAPPMPTAMNPEMAPSSDRLAPQGMTEGTPENALRMPNAQDALLKRPSPPPADTQLATDLQVSPPASAPIQDVVPDVAPDVIQADPMPTRIEPPMAAAPQPVAEPSAALIEKMDQILSRLDGLESDINALKTADRSGDTSQLDAQLKAVKTSLTALERKIDARPAVVPAAAPRKPDPVAVTPNAQILGSSAPAVRAPRPPVAQPAPAPAAPRWVLKGAQPGRAMVAQPGDSDLRTVEVGDTLPGLGRITAIVYQNGRWQVQATQGQLNQ